jgi:hypothetical protein
MITDKNEILKKLGITLEQVFGPAPEWARWFAIDENGASYFYRIFPKLLDHEHHSIDKVRREYHLTKEKPFDLTGIDWRVCCWERPVDETKWIGLLGWFWDDLGPSGYAIELKKINDKSEHKYNGTWRHFRPLTVIELTEYLQRAKDAGIEG